MNERKLYVSYYQEALVFLRSTRVLCERATHEQRLSKIPLVRGLLIGQTNCTRNETLTA
jgi:hypothetical protein